MDLLTFVIFFLVLGGSIFLHELGHYVAARLAGIEVEEFGFGLPPRMLRFWRISGTIQVGNQEFVLPTNFELPFEREDGLGRGLDVVATRVDDKLVAKSVAYAATEDGQFRPTYPQLTTGTDGLIRFSGVAKKISPGTEFTLNWLPLGGFVRPRGENDPNVLDGLSAANPWKRLGVLFAGPLMNLLTAVVVFALIISMSGVAVDGPVTITSVSAGSPAHWAGFEPGDVIRSINGQEIQQSALARQIIFDNLGVPVDFVVLRDGQEVNINVTPSTTRTQQQGALGIGMESATRPATFGESVMGGFTLTGLQAVTVLSIPVLLIQNAIEPELARPVGLVGMFGMFSQAVERDTETRQQAAEAASAGEEAPMPSNYTLYLLASLSISLGVFNLLPIPALDGGRILFTLPEILFRRRIPYRLENIVNGAAFLLLIGLMIFVNLMDIFNPANITLP